MLFDNFQEILLFNPRPANLLKHTPRHYPLSLEIPKWRPKTNKQQRQQKQFKMNWKIKGQLCMNNVLGFPIYQQGRRNREYMRTVFLKRECAWDPAEGLPKHRALGIHHWRGFSAGAVAAPLWPTQCRQFTIFWGKIKKLKSVVLTERIQKKINYFLVLLKLANDTHITLICIEHPSKKDQIRQGSVRVQRCFPSHVGNPGSLRFDKHVDCSFWRSF